MLSDTVRQNVIGVITEIRDDNPQGRGRKSWTRQAGGACHLCLLSLGHARLHVCHQGRSGADAGSARCAHVSHSSHRC